MRYIKRREREEGINGEGEDGEGSGRDKGKTRAGNERIEGDTLLICHN